MECKNCEHNCHCGNNGQCKVCACSMCEHNALDEFWKRVDQNAKSLMNLQKHKD